MSKIKKKDIEKVIDNSGKEKLGGNLQPLLPELDKPDFNIVKNRLKVIIAEKNMSQTELAEGIGISKTTLSNIVNMYQNATLSTALDIAKFLNTTVEKIFYKESEEFLYSVDEFEKMLNDFKQVYELYQRGTLTEDVLRIVYQDKKTKFIDNFGIQEFQILADDFLDNYRDNRFAFEILLLR